MNLPSFSNNWLFFPCLLCFRSLSSERHKIHTNLVVSLLFANVLFLAGINETSSPVRRFYSYFNVYCTLIYSQVLLSWKLLPITFPRKIYEKCNIYVCNNLEKYLFLHIEYRTRRFNCGEGVEQYYPFLVSVYRYTYVMNMTAAVFSLCFTNNAVYVYLDNFTYIGVTIGPSAVNFNEN